MGEAVRREACRPEGQLGCEGASRSSGGGGTRMGEAVRREACRPEGHPSWGRRGARGMMNGPLSRRRSRFAPLAQSAERFHGKEKVDSSILSGGSSTASIRVHEGPSRRSGLSA